VSAVTDSETSVLETSQYPAHARRRVPLLLLAIAAVLALIATVGAYEVVKKQSPSYRAQAAVSLDQPLKLAQSNSSGEIDKLSRLRTTYIGVIRFDSVVSAVAKETKLTNSQVRKRVFAAADPASLLLIIGANDRTGPSARRLATAMADQVIVYIQQSQDQAKVPTQDRITAHVVVTPDSATLTDPTTRKALTTGIVTGILVFFVIVGIGTLLRRP
jgi:capsular polysaccharide biosynthesis protein